MNLAVVTAEHCYLRKTPGSMDGANTSGIEDEIFSGWAVRMIPETEESGWVQIETHYGYKGYVWAQELRSIDTEELCARQDPRRFYRMGAPEADLLDQPKVQGLPLELILKNAFVELIAYEAEKGWSIVRTAAGREGYIHTAYLRERMDDDGYLLDRDIESCIGEKTQDHGYFRSRFLAKRPKEDAFRIKLAESAKAYLGTQYRWGGKSSQGLDCSGLVFMSYFENGVLIYRDARIVEAYPVREIPPEKLKTGDLIFFPGHVAMYLGNSRYIHSTAYDATPCVTINSLDPNDPDFREDLAGKITGCGSVFT